MSWPNADWERLRLERRERILKYMKTNKFDALLLVCADNIRYATDIATLWTAETMADGHAAIVSRVGNVHILSSMFSERILKSMFPWVSTATQLPAWSPSSCQVSNWVSLISRILTDEKITHGSIGVDFLPFEIYEGIRSKYPDLEIAPILKDLLRIRAVKTEDEVMLLKEAACICDAAASKALQSIKPGMSEYELAGIIVGELGRSGAEGLTHYPALRSGKREGASPSSKRFSPGESVIFDIGVFGEGGYACDLCRTGFVGKPTAELRKCYEMLLEVHLAAIEKLRPGVLSSEINEFINSALENRGYQGTRYANGHGIGLRMMEMPTIDNKENLETDILIEEGMVINLEPITYCSEGAVKLEDVTYVSAMGGERLTRTAYWEF